MLLVSDPEEDAAAKVGTPCVYGATATTEVMVQIKGDKIEVVKFKRKKGCRVKRGHRQKYLRVKITDIKGQG